MCGCQLDGIEIMRILGVDYCIVKRMRLLRKENEELIKGSGTYEECR